MSELCMRNWRSVVPELTVVFRLPRAWVTNRMVWVRAGRSSLHPTDESVSDSAMTSVAEQLLSNDVVSEICCWRKLPTDRWFGLELTGIGERIISALRFSLGKKIAKNKSQMATYLIHTRGGQTTTHGPNAARHWPTRSSGSMKVRSLEIIWWNHGTGWHHPRQKKDCSSKFPPRCPEKIKGHRSITIMDSNSEKSTWNSPFYPTWNYKHFCPFVPAAHLMGH